MVKNLLVNAENASLIRGSGRASGGGHGNLSQYSCLEYPMDRGAWKVTVHGVGKELDRTYTKILCLATVLLSTSYDVDLDNLPNLKFRKMHKYMPRFLFFIIGISNMIPCMNHFRFTRWSNLCL